jgi:hypothetical protein
MSANVWRYRIAKHYWRAVVMVRTTFATDQVLEDLGVALERRAEFRQSAEWLSNFHHEEGGNSHTYLYYFAPLTS